MKKRFSQTVISGAVLLAALACTGMAQAAEKTVDGSNSEGFTAADGVIGNSLLIKDGANVSGSLYGAYNNGDTTAQDITVDMSGGTITKTLYGGSGGSADGIKVTVSGGLITNDLTGFDSYGGSAKNISLDVSGSAEVGGRVIGANNVGEADDVTVKTTGGTLNRVYGVYSSGFTTSVQNTVLEIGGDVVIGGTNKPYAEVIAVRATPNGTVANNVLKITGGKITGTIGSSVNQSTKVAAVDVGVPTQSGGFLKIQGNRLEISGGSISNAYVFGVNSSFSTTNPIEVSDTTVEISGGEVNAGVVAAVSAYADKNTVNNSTVSISDGTISAKGIYGTYVDRPGVTSEVGASTINISGGTFTLTTGQSSITVAGFGTDYGSPTAQGTTEINLDGSAHSDGLDLGALAFSGTNSTSAAMNVAGNITASTSITDFNTISLDKGATLAAGKLSQTKDKDTPTQIYLQDTSNKITIGTLNADLSVNGSGEMNDAGENAQASINAVKDAITVTDEASSTGSIKKIELAEGELAGKVVAKDTGNGLQITEQAANSKQQAYQSLRALQTLQWRHELNDLTKRMGELRTSPAGVGSWARLYGSEQEYGPQSMTMRNTSIQVGTDSDLGGGWKVGGAFSYTDGSADYSLGDADTKAWSLGIYGTWLGEDGQFVDLMAKYHRLSTDFRLNNYDGSYDNNAFSVSAEYGWHLKLSELGFVEPQVELTYGRIMGDDFNAGTSVRVEQKDLEALIGRAGLRAGFYLPQNKGTVYARVSGAYDFLGDEEYTARAGNRTETFKTDLGGAWVEYAVGANFNLTDRCYTYVDLERTSGGETQENWRWNLGLRYVW